MANPFEGKWFMALSVMRNEHGLSEGYPLGKKGELAISSPEPNVVKLKLTHPGNPLRPPSQFEGTSLDGPPASFTALGVEDSVGFELQGYLTDSLKPGLKIVGGYVQRNVGPPGGESDGEGSWIASDERPNPMEDKARSKRR